LIGEASLRLTDKKYKKTSPEKSKDKIIKIILDDNEGKQTAELLYSLSVDGLPPSLIQKGRPRSSTNAKNYKNTELPSITDYSTLSSHMITGSSESSNMVVSKISSKKTLTVLNPLSARASTKASSSINLKESQDRERRIEKTKEILDDENEEKSELMESRKKMNKKLKNEEETNEFSSYQQITEYSLKSSPSSSSLNQKSDSSNKIAVTSKQRPFTASVDLPKNKELSESDKIISTKSVKLSPSNRYPVRKKKLKFINIYLNIYTIYINSF
jgi:hypothetical protein